MKKIIMIGLLISLLGVCGCAKRIEISTIEKERVDQDVSSGNKGYLCGNPPPETEPREHFTKREVVQVTVELPPYDDWNRFRKEDKELWGNRGFVYGGPGSKPTTVVEEKQEEQIELPQEEPVAIEKEKNHEAVPAKKSSVTVYVVKSGDTLGKIAKTVYGNSSRWKNIYDANKDVLKSPNKIFPGQKLKIPQD